MLTVSTYRGEPMKKCRITAFVLAFSMLLLLTACADTGTADRKKNRDNTDEISIEDAVWKRFESLDPSPEGYTLVFGHTPTRYYQSSVPVKIWHDGSRIGIDCGSGYPEEGLGRLACLRLDDGAEFYSAEPERKEP